MGYSTIDSFSRIIVRSTIFEERINLFEAEYLNICIICILLFIGGQKKCIERRY